MGRLAGRQKHLVRTDQLLALGFSRGCVTRRMQARRLFRLHRKVFATHPPPYSPQQRFLAAVYACAGSLLSDGPAAWLLGLTDGPCLIAHISNATGAGRGLEGVVVHRRRLGRLDRTVRHGIPSTTATRTIVDLAASIPLLELEQALLAADSKHLLKRGRLEQLLAERHGQPGTRRLRSLITADPVEVRNVNEARLFSICREFGVPLPHCNHRIQVASRTFYADFCWPGLKLIVEADSWRWHGSRSAAENDTDRDQLLAMAGWQVVHFTRDQILNSRRETGRRLVALAEAGCARRLA